MALIVLLGINLSWRKNQWFRDSMRPSGQKVMSLLRSASKWMWPVKVKLSKKLWLIFVRIITLDNGSEFASNHFDWWAYQRGIQLDFITPGRPVENGIIESFNGKLRDECLNVHWFQSLEEARRLIERWRQEYNDIRPHSSLGNLAPARYVEELLRSASVGELHTQPVLQL